MYLNTHDPNRLKPAHYEEWVHGSGVSPQITNLNIISLTDKREIAHRLCWKAYIHDIYGWWVSGVDPWTGDSLPYGQFKPDQPLQLNQEKPSKYIGPKKEIPHNAICLRMPDPLYWRQVLEDPTVPIVITEEAKKAGAGLSIGLVTLALAGVEMGLNNGQLVSILEMFAVPGREFILAFDSDIVTKLEVKQALIRLANTLKRKGSTIRVAQWQVEEGKGMDDAILTLGPEQFKARIQESIPYKQWLKTLEDPSNQKTQKGTGKQEKRAPPASRLAARLAAMYQDQLAWNDELEEWFRYELHTPGVWSLAGEVGVWQLIRAELDADDLPYSAGYLGDVTRLLRCDLLVRDWDPPAHFLPLENGVLNLNTRELFNHDPSYHFTWSLPYSFDPWADCEQIKVWMLEAMGGHEDRVQVLRAFLNAIVSGRTDLQRYLECVGPAGTGKSTFIRLAEALVGKDNNFTTELKHLEQNRFETFGIFGKRLVAITDSERYGGNITVLKALTGSDTVSTLGRTAVSLVK